VVLIYPPLLWLGSKICPKGVDARWARIGVSKRLATIEITCSACSFPMQKLFRCLLYKLVLNLK
jgi:hypothetical protein